MNINCSDTAKVSISNNKKLQNFKAIWLCTLLTLLQGDGDVRINEAKRMDKQGVKDVCEEKK